MQNAWYGFRDNKNTSDKQDNGVNNSSKQSKALVTIRVMLIAFLFREFLKIPGQTQRKRIAKVVYGIRKNGDTIGEQASDNFDDGKTKIQKKCHADVFYISVVRMIMLMGMMIVHVFLFG